VGAYGNTEQVLRQASFDRLRTNGKWLISFVVSLSNHTASQLIQRFPSYKFHDQSGIQCDKSAINACSHRAAIGHRIAMMQPYS
jgi:hypothetical protein